MKLKCKLVLSLLLSIFFISTPLVFAQGGVLVSPPDQDDDGSAEVMDLPDQGNANAPYYHRHHRHRDHNDNEAFFKDPQNSDLYLFGGEYDSPREVQDDSHRGSESRSVAQSSHSHSATARPKDDSGKKGEK